MVFGIPGIWSVLYLMKRVRKDGENGCWATWRQRIRDVRQGPDGLLYVLTDADEAALLKLEPVD